MNVLTFSTSTQRQVTTSGTLAVTPPNKCHVSGCRREPAASAASYHNDNAGQGGRKFTFLQPHFLITTSRLACKTSTNDIRWN